MIYDDDDGDDDDGDDDDGGDGHHGERGILLYDKTWQKIICLYEHLNLSLKGSRNPFAWQERHLCPYILSIAEALLTHFNTDALMLGLLRI